MLRIQGRRCVSFCLTFFNPLTPTVIIGTDIKHPVPDRIKSSFVIFDIRALWRSDLSVRLYDDDTQFHDSCRLDDIDLLRTRLSPCANDINLWCQSRGLQLNANKTEAIWFGSKANMAKLNNMDSYIQVGPCQIQSNRWWSSATSVFIWIASCQWNITSPWWQRPATIIYDVCARFVVAWTRKSLSVWFWR